MAIENQHHFIVRDEAGEKIAEYMNSQVPRVADIIPIDYASTQGNFVVLRAVPRKLANHRHVIILTVRQIEKR